MRTDLRRVANRKNVVRMAHVAIVRDRIRRVEKAIVHATMARVPMVLVPTAIVGRRCHRADRKNFAANVAAASMDRPAPLVKASRFRHAAMNRAGRFKDHLDRRTMAQRLAMAIRPDHFLAARARTTWSS